MPKKSQNQAAPSPYAGMLKADLLKALAQRDAQIDEKDRVIVRHQCKLAGANNRSAWTTHMNELLSRNLKAERLRLNDMAEDLASALEQAAHVPVLREQIAVLNEANVKGTGFANGLREAIVLITDTSHE